MNRVLLLKILRRLLLLVVIVVTGLYLLVGALSTEPPGPPAVSNDSGQTIDVYLVGAEDGEDLFVFTLAPGAGAGIVLGLEGDCTAHDLVALGPDETEIDRRGPGFCEGQVWRVVGDS